jgi:hypothetical protein
VGDGKEHVEWGWGFGAREGDVDIWKRGLTGGASGTGGIRDVPLGSGGINARFCARFFFLF